MDLMVVGVVAVIGLISGLILGIKIKKPSPQKRWFRILFYCTIGAAAGAVVGWFSAPVILSFV